MATGRFRIKIVASASLPDAQNECDGTFNTRACPADFNSENHRRKSAHGRVFFDWQPEDVTATSTPFGVNIEYACMTWAISFLKGQFITTRLNFRRGFQFGKSAASTA
jgi:hypothetical protein